MNSIKQSGILLHPTALPGQYGIGELGKEAYRFVDLLSEMGQSLWQVLPLGPTDSTFSPYSSSSAFAGNPYLISIDLLLEAGLIDKSYIRLQEFNHERIDSNKIDSFKMNLLFKAASKIVEKDNENFYDDFLIFCNKNSYWLDEYALYCSIKIENDNTSWHLWDNQEIQNNHLVDTIKAIQFLFDLHWMKLKSYANDKGIKIIGDMPIYVSYDSCDVWSNRELFQLNEDGSMLYEAGCPPCEYNVDGQHWGMPVYNWKKHLESNFDWWNKRFKRMFSMLDTVRIDHFIGFTRFYSIPIDQSPRDGFWSDSPGNKLLDSLSIQKNNYDIFVEDLGDTIEEVFDLRDRYGLPGTRVLQFDMGDNISYQSFENDYVLYTGTHDNDTLIGWIESLEDYKRKEIYNCYQGDKINWDLIKFSMNSKFDRVIIPLQDILGLDSQHRFNTPGTLSDRNWVWRFNFDSISMDIVNRMREITMSTNRDN